MKLTFQWQTPLTLTQNKKIVVTIDDLDQIADEPGIYYFC